MSVIKSAENTPVDPREDLRRPGWPEIIIGVAVAFLLLSITPVVSGLLPDADMRNRGLLLMCWSVVVPFAGFTAAKLVRSRPLTDFAIRATTRRWLLAAVGIGIAAFLVKGVANMAIMTLTGFEENAQSAFYDSSSSGLLPLVAMVATVSLLVPIGEEFLFRGVLMRGLLRYGAVVAVLGSTMVFAVFHGINMALPSAFVVGLVAAEVTRRCGSIWPAVVIHVVNNLAAPVFVVLGGASAVG